MPTHQPRYAEIADYLRSLIAESEPGDRLPSDADLADRFEVSRMTARQAVQVLASEQLLVREQGRGTFVTDHPVPRVLGSPLSFTDSTRLRGMTATSRTLAMETAAPDIDDARALEISADAHVGVLERLRLADGVPMAIEPMVPRRLRGWSPTGTNSFPSRPVPMAAVKRTRTKKIAARTGRLR